MEWISIIWSDPSAAGLFLDVLGVVLVAGFSLGIVVVDGREATGSRVGAVIFRISGWGMPNRVSSAVEFAGWVLILTGFVAQIGGRLITLTG